uniref:Uncharacterized protein n=1 Tax=Arundo donax TaxID=35708 RepID=A0A0A8Y7J0_ARUDO
MPYIVMLQTFSHLLGCNYSIRNHIMLSVAMRNTQFFSP